jgi:cbb3-type cytochrome oxidase cytochrome c subunit
MATIDQNVVERAQRAVGQLDTHVKELLKKKVKLESRMKTDATELEEVDALIAFLEAE